MGTWASISSPHIEFFCYDPGGYLHKNNNMPNYSDTEPKPNKVSKQLAMPHVKAKVALYVSCLVNSLRPNVGFDCVKLLESLDLEVFIPPDQTCCGQPAYNGGHRAQAIAVAKHQIAALSNYDYLVVPSGSCAGMFINHYPRLLADDPVWLKKTQALAGKTKELCQFLIEQNWQPTSMPSNHHMTLAYHTSCSCRRETQSHQHGEALIKQAGFTLSAMQDQEVCCGFGGSFAAKFDSLSGRMGDNKLKCAVDSGASALVSADLGCLLHLDTLKNNATTNMKFFHIAELLADACDDRGRRE